jgi:hypothetical protein
LKYRFAGHKVVNILDMKDFVNVTNSVGKMEKLHKAKEKNPERYCKLFGDPYMSFQVLDNPNAKKDYREAGCR